MIVLSVTGINKSYGVDAILKNIDLTVQEGSRLGIVGTNGAGKSTLLKIIAGVETRDSGDISILKGHIVEYLPQNPDFQSDSSIVEELSRVFEPLKRMEEKMAHLAEAMARGDEKAGDQYARLFEDFERSGGYEWPSRLRGTLKGLGFPEEQWDKRASTLSGGERTRLCLARLLLSQPDIALLDEPTNHLDLPAMQWLEDTLKQYKGTVILISHDRFFLNAVCTHMAEIIGRNLDQYEGNYDRFVRLREESRTNQLKQFEAQQEEIRRQQAIIARFKMYNTERSLRSAHSREKAIDRIDRVDKPITERGVRFAFEARRRTGDDVLIAHGLRKAYARELFSDVNLHIRAGERVALIGGNGAGKSTLLKILSGEIAPDGGDFYWGANVDMGYYDQHQSVLNEDNTAIDEIWDAFPRMHPDDVRKVLALFLFTGDDVFKPVSALSGGERGRIALLKLMLRRDNVLLFDEPTNHLDMDSMKVLEDALKQYTGTILAVSHDRYFINRLFDRVLDMQGGTIKEYLGNYDDFVDKRRRDALSDASEAIGATRTQIDKEKKRDRAQKSARQMLFSAVESAEADIHKLESDKAALEDRMANISGGYDETLKLSELYREITHAIERAYAQWEQFHGQLDQS